jgi:hypothetical protein
MTGWLGRSAGAAAFVLLGWTVGGVQAPTPDFELAIEIPAGFAKVNCVRGCSLVGARDAGVRAPKAEYTFGCSATADRCPARIHGFVQLDAAGSKASGDEATLLGLQQALARAWMAGNRAEIERIIAPEWRSTGPDGRTADRASVLAQVLETRVHRIERIEIDDVMARVVGNAAVVTGRTHGVGAFDGAPYDVVIRFTDTFVRREGRWQAIASHASVVQ